VKNTRKKRAKARPRRKSRSPKKSTLADYKRVLEIQKNDPAKFNASPRLQAIVELWREANVKAWTELSRAPITVDLPKMEAASEAWKALSPRGRAIVDDLDFGDAAEVLVPLPTKPGRPMAKVTAQRISLAVTLTRAGKNQRQMAAELFPQSRDAYLDTRRFFNRYRKTIAAQSNISSDTSH
jgi:hypothetical protein